MLDTELYLAKPPATEETEEIEYDLKDINIGSGWYRIETDVVNMRYSERKKTPYNPRGNGQTERFNRTFA